MAVPTAADIIFMGFSHQMFGYDSESSLNITIDDLLKEHGAILAGRIGSSAYASPTEPISTYVKRTLKNLVAADLCQMRINRLAQDIKQEDGTDATKMRRQRMDYLTEAEQLIGKIETANSSGGTGGDFAFGSVITSHFDGDDS